MRNTLETDYLYPGSPFITSLPYSIGGFFVGFLQVFCRPVDATANREIMNDELFVNHLMYIESDEYLERKNMAIESAKQSGFLNILELYDINEGDVINLNIFDTPIDFVVMGFNVDEDENGDKIPITLMNTQNYGRTFNDNYQWNTNGSPVINYLNQLYNSNMTEQFKNHIIKSKRITSLSNRRDYVTYEYITTPSCYELGHPYHGKNSYIFENSGVQYCKPFEKSYIISKLPEVCTFGLRSYTSGYSGTWIFQKTGPNALIPNPDLAIITCYDSIYNTVSAPYRSVYLRFLMCFR